MSVVFQCLMLLCCGCCLVVSGFRVGLLVLCMFFLTSAFVLVFLVLLWLTRAFRRDLLCWFVCVSVDSVVVAGVVAMASLVWSSVLLLLLL